MAAENGAEAAQLEQKLTEEAPVQKTETEDQKMVDEDAAPAKDENGADNEPAEGEKNTGEDSASSSSENGADSEPTELEEKIIKQIEYYFGDMNLPRDKFLQQAIKEEDGWISLETMLKFNRLSQLSTDLAAIATAVKKSTTGLLEISDDNVKIRRSEDKPLPEFNKARRDDLRGRSIYAKGFPEDSTLDQMLTFFEKAGKTEHIQMRRAKDRNFKGSCFVIYAATDSAKKFLTGEETAKYGETELVRSLRDDYYKRKSAEKKDIRQEEIKKKQHEKDEYIKKQEDEKKQNLSERITHGAVLSLKNIPKDTTREQLKAVFEGHGTVAWAEFDKGDTEGKLRFQGENSAKEALEKLKEANDGKTQVKDTDVECAVLEGEDELEYWKFVFQSQKANRDKKQGKGQRGRGFGGRGRGGGFKRRSTGDRDHSDGPRAKMSKYSD